jgi:hypothetical protein
VRLSKFVKCRFEAQAHVFVDGHRFLQASADRNGAGSLQNADSRIADPRRASRRGCECIEVEIIARSPVGWSWIAHDVRANNRAIQFRIGVGLIKLRVNRRSRIWTRFEQCDGAQAPTTECLVQQAGRAGPVPAVAEWKFVCASQQKPLAPRALDISTICTDIETVQIRESVCRFTRECGRCVPLGVADVVRPGVIRREIQTL